MKHAVIGILAFCIAAAGLAVGAEKYQPGLLAHYFSDPDHWDGNWPGDLSLPLPQVNPTDWTFSRYQYSRVEPVINHEFVRRGWFSVRWTGYLDTRATAEDAGVVSVVEGTLNLNPNNSVLNSFALKLPDGRTIADRDIARQGFNGYSGTVSQVIVKPKGNSDENMLTVDGVAYALRNKETYTIVAPAIEAVLYNQAANGPGQPAGQWWLRLSATGAVITCSFDGLTPAIEAGPQGAGSAEYTFEIHADDGCRLFIDGKTVIDDWRPCWEKLPSALRRSQPVLLDDGKHEIRVEYFQGQSLDGTDSDPMRLYWACQRKGIARQLIRPEHFLHSGTPDPSPARQAATATRSP